VHAGADLAARPVKENSMSGSGRKAVMALLGSVVLAGLMMPASANAATLPAVRAKVCNDADVSQGFALAGRNQNGNWYEQPVYGSISARSCGTFDGDWWATDQHLQVHFYRTRDNSGKPREVTTTSYIGKNFRNGQTVTVRISRVAP
jgi:hypothetical protein